jgi:acyl phosphate:glycerol-3-phosphate acyltransferase
MTAFWIDTIAALAFGYVLGSIPFGLILTRLAGGGDIRDVGSGNIGATNVLRTGKKWLAALTLIFDLLKGTVAVLLSQHVFVALGPQGSGALAAAGAFFGHLYPVWLRFVGGKGVATYAGIMLGLFWQGGLIYAAVWIGGVLISRKSSVGGLLAAVAAPIAALLFNRMDIFALLIACSLIVFWKHQANIERLLKGEEPRIGAKKVNA